MKKQIKGWTTKQVIVISIVIVILTYGLTMFSLRHYFQDYGWAQWMEGDMARWNPKAPAEGHYRIIIQAYDYKNNTFVEKDIPYWDSKPSLYMKGERFSLLKCWNCD